MREGAPVTGQGTPDDEVGQGLCGINFCCQWCNSSAALDTQHGGTGTAVLREPLVLGHEVAGRIVALGARVKGFDMGEPVTIHPATLVGDHVMPSHVDGRDNLWPEVRYFGSAAFVPHEHGGFSTYRVVRPDQLRKLPAGVSTRIGSVAEPLGVAIHAIKRSGGVEGKRVLVNGAGPIGALCVAAAKHAGAAEIWVSDIAAGPLGIARAMGADHTVERMLGEELPVDVDVSFEASGAPATIGDVLRATVRGGKMVQVGNLPPGPSSIDLGQLVTREIEYVGSYRFIDEISDALLALAEGLNIEPLLTHEFDIDDAQAAFETAADRSSGSSKVLLRLS